MMPCEPKWRATYDLRFAFKNFGKAMRRSSRRIARLSNAWERTHPAYMVVKSQRSRRHK